MKLNWQLARDMHYRQELWMSSDFLVAVEPTTKELTHYRAAVIRRGGCCALYRSARVWPEAEAKRQAIIAGARVARREARIHGEIADLLKCCAKELPAPGGPR